MQAKERDQFDWTQFIHGRLVHYRELSGVPVTAQRLRHTFANQMLTVGMPVSYLKLYLDHEYLDTTTIYARLSDLLLRQDYYQGIATFDIFSENQPTNGLLSSQQDLLRQLIKELKTPDLEPTRHDEILDQMQRLQEDDSSFSGFYFIALLKAFRAKFIPKTAKPAEIRKQIHKGIFATEPIMGAGPKVIWRKPVTT